MGTVTTATGMAMATADRDDGGGFDFEGGLLGAFGPPTVEEMAGWSTREWDEELAAIRADPAYFIDRYGWIERPRPHEVAEGAPGGEASLVAHDPEDVEGASAGAFGPVRFRLWPDQVDLVGTLREERLVVVLKARQLGISWVVIAYVLWKALVRPSGLALLFSKGQRESSELIRRMLMLLSRLPAGLVRRLPRRVSKPNTREIAWANGSRVISMPATANAGISYTADTVVMDEAAHPTMAQSLYTMVKPTIDEGHQFIMLSTANGLGGLFHATWRGAVAGTNGFYPVFLPWWSRPGRDADWYRRIVAESNDPDTVPQNYPSNPVEAFRASGSLRFRPEWIEAQVANLKAPLQPEALPPTLLDVPGFMAWEAPLPGHTYAIGGDTAEGVEGGDYDAAPVVDRATLRQVAEIHGLWEPADYAAILSDVGRAYNGAAVVVERNNHGHAVILALQYLRYPEIALGHDGKPGWLSNHQTKPPSVDCLAEHLKESTIVVRSLGSLGELQDYKKLPSGDTGASEGSHDDLVMGWAILLRWLRVEAERAETWARQHRVDIRRNPIARYRG
jgi:hypothetical protein